jgi:SAM-dependent methyltransferase
MKNANIGMIVLVLLQALWPSSAHAQSTQNSKIEEEALKQESIYQSKGDKVPEGYVIGRALPAYVNALPSEFGQDLANLGTSGRWLDIGAGEGQAILDYYNPVSPLEKTRDENKAQSVAISIEDRRTTRWHQTAARLETNQIRYLYGKSLRDYKVEELGKFQIITDLLGGFSYTKDLYKFIEKTLSLLQVNGSFYSILQDVHSENGSNQPFYTGAPFLTEILNPDGSKMQICTWLKNISCVQVRCEFKSGWRPPVEIYRVQKVCDSVTVPPLTPVHFTAGTPPERRFQFSNSSSVPPVRNSATP